jgi:hypothetical protein
MLGRRDVRSVWRGGGRCRLWAVSYSLSFQYKQELDIGRGSGRPQLVWKLCKRLATGVREAIRRRQGPAHPASVSQARAEVKLTLSTPRTRVHLFGAPARSCLRSASLYSKRGDTLLAPRRTHGSRPPPWLHEATRQRHER